MSCPRCGHENQPVARYCSHCGVHLDRAHAVDPLDRSRRHRRRTGTWLVIGLVLLGAGLATFALFHRQRPQHRLFQQAQPNQTHFHMFYEQHTEEVIEP